jgi:hypothetical protein
LRAPERGEIPTANAEIGAHHQEPVHALRLGAQQLDALPFRKSGDQQMGGAADEFEAAVLHCGERMLDRNHQLKRDVEPFTREEAELHGRHRGEVGVGDQIGDGELHRCPLGRGRLARNCYAL